MFQLKKQERLPYTVAFFIGLLRHNALSGMCNGDLNTDAVSKTLKIQNGRNTTNRLFEVWFKT